MSKTRRAPPSRTIIVCPDVHVPFHDKRAWRCLLAAVRLAKPVNAPKNHKVHFVIVGDFADFYAVSFYSKAADRAKLLKPEIRAVNVELDQVSALQEEGVIDYTTFLGGNHEFRLERYLNEKAPELFGLIDVPTLFKFEERGWDYVPYGESLTLGKMDITHDVGRCGKNAARASLADYGHNLVIGHTHQLATVYEGSVHEDSKRVCMNVGWLGSVKHIDYRHKSMAKRSYQHGFGLIHQDSTGFSSCHAIPIHKGKCEINGQWVQV